MTKLYYVSPCHVEDGPNTWDVVRRATTEDGKEGCVSNHNTRAQARHECAKRNEEWTNMVPHRPKTLAEHAEDLADAKMTNNP